MVMIGQIQMSIYSYMLGIGYIDDSEDGYIDDVEEGYTAELIDMRFVLDFDQCSEEINVVWIDICEYPRFYP